MDGEIFIEMPLLYQVIDKKTGKDVLDEMEELGKEFDLMSMDMESVAIQDDGGLVLLDECGRFAFLPRDRFEIHWYPEVVKQGLVDEMIRTSKAYGYPCRESGMTVHQIMDEEVKDSKAEVDELKNRGIDPYELTKVKKD